MHIEYEVTMVDGEKHKVVVDGRDYAAMEVQEFPLAAIVTKSRYLAWRAMTRQQLTTVPFKKFNEDQCAGVKDITPDDEDGGEGGSLNPTHRGIASSA